MNEMRFREWMAQKNINRKVQSDLISRIKKVEKEFNYCDIDKEYTKDECKYILGLFQKKNYNSLIADFPNSAFANPQKNLNTYRHAINKYISFCKDNN